ncbi:hypothetical protein OV450_8519, partial [Actinobacteria bacterium OV450]
MSFGTVLASVPVRVIGEADGRLQPDAQPDARTLISGLLQGLLPRHVRCGNLGTVWSNGPLNRQLLGGRRHGGSSAGSMPAAASPSGAVCVSRTPIRARRRGISASPGASRRPARPALA